MNLDSIVSEIEKDAIQWGTKLVITQLGLASWAAMPILGPLLSMFISKIVKLIVDGIDLIAYYKYKAVVNNAQAVQYQDAVYATQKATEKGDKDAISKARANQIAMFDKLFSYTK